MSDQVPFSTLEDAIDTIVGLRAELAAVRQEPRVTCVSRDSQGNAMETVHLLGDPEAVKAVMGLKDRAVAAEVALQETRQALTAIRDLPTEHDLLLNAAARALHEIARRALAAGDTDGTKPTLPLFDSGQPDLGEQADKHFGAGGSALAAE